MDKEQMNGITITPMVPVYRICIDTEHGDYGPFSANFHTDDLVVKDVCDAYRFHFAMQKEPREDGIPNPSGYRSGFLPNTQQLYWLQNPFFGTKGRLLNKMQEVGFVIREYLVPLKYIHIGEHQVMFHPERATFVKNHAILDVLDEMDEHLDPRNLDTDVLIKQYKEVHGILVSTSKSPSILSRFQLNQSVRKYFKKYRNMLATSN
jgi:hypothetical protein